MRCVLSLAVVAVVASPLLGEEKRPAMRVILKDGTELTGQPDSTTDDLHLRLRRGSAELFLVRHIPWSTVVSAEHKGRSYTGVKLKKLVQRLKNAPGSRKAKAVRQDQNAVESSKNSLEVNTRAKAGRVREVVLVDAFVENTSLVVLLRLAHENPVAPQGNLGVELVGLPHGRRNFAAAPGRRTNKVSRISRWTRSITPDDFDRGVAIFRLPLGKRLDEKFADFGLVRYRLTLPGHGTFESSKDGVELRPFSPVHGAIERHSGRRPVR